MVGASVRRNWRFAPHIRRFVAVGQDDTHVLSRDVTDEPLSVSLPALELEQGLTLIKASEIDECFCIYDGRVRPISQSHYTSVDVDEVGCSSSPSTWWSAVGFVRRARDIAIHAFCQLGCDLSVWPLSPNNLGRCSTLIPIGGCGARPSLSVASLSCVVVQSSHAMT